MQSWYAFLDQKELLAKTSSQNKNMDSGKANNKKWAKEVIGHQSYKIKHVNPRLKREPW